MKKNIKLYFILYFCAYFVLSMPKVCGEEFKEHETPQLFSNYFEDYRESHFSGTEDGYNFSENEESIYDLDSFLQYSRYQKIPTRRELMEQLVHHYGQYCDARTKAKEAVHRVNIWNNAWEDLFLSASAAVTTYGSCNYIQCFSTALIIYASTNFVRFYKEGEELYFQLIRMDEHAKSFDFYMKILKHYYKV